MRGSNPVDVLLGRTAPSHLPTARSVLNRMAAHFSDGRLDARSFPWHELTYAQVAELRAQLGRQYAPRTANNYLSTLKGVLREAKRLGLLDAASFDLLTDQPPVRGETLPAGRHVQADELERLFAYLGTLETASGARDRATFALLRGTGIRRAEAASLDLDAYQPFRSQLTVEHGKGRKERVVFLPAWVIGEVEDWLSWRGHEPGALLCRVDKHDNLYPRHHLHPDTLWERFVAHVQAAGVEHFTPHDLRRTFAGDLLEAGHDLVKVQRAMGHTYPSQTARYDCEDRGAAPSRDLTRVTTGRGALCLICRPSARGGMCCRQTGWACPDRGLAVQGTITVLTALPGPASATRVPEPIRRGDRAQHAPARPAR